MGFRINTNIAAMDAHRNSTMNNIGLDKSLKSLSSGLRINTAADDASGLTIANSLKAQSTGLGQAIRNANDGIGVTQTADGALDEYENIINTVRTKAIQAASDGQNTDSRAAIQRDIDKLLEEAQNIVDTTSFNGLKLLNGTFSDKNFQIGAYANETVGVSIDNASTNSIGKLAELDSTTTQTNLDGIDTDDILGKAAANITDGTYAQLAVGALKVNGTDLAGALVGQGGDQYSALGLANAINAVSADTGVTATAETVWTGTGTIGGGSITDGGLYINGVNIGPVTVKSNDSDGALVSAINAKQSDTGVTASVNGSGVLTLTAKDGENIALYNGGTYSATSFSSTLGAGFVDNRTIVELDATWAADAAYTMKIDGVDMTFTGDTDDATTNDAMYAKLSSTLDSSIYSVTQSGGAGALVEIMRKDGKDINIIGENDGDAVDVTMTLHDADGTTASATVVGDNALIGNNSYHGTVKLSSDTTIEVAGDATALRSFGFNTDGTTTSVVESASGGIADADVTTYEAAQTTIQRADSALKALDEIRSNLGSTQNQLESTVRNISVTQVNVAAAESQIRDVDFAAESATFAKHNILAQSGAYAMSQANAVQQNVMRLLQ